MVAEATQLCTSVLKAERVLFFMYNKDIDHLYSLSARPNQVAGSFGIDSIRMKATLGLSGGAFTSAKIMIERDIDQGKDSESLMCPEEKDLKKLQISSLKNAIAIPIFDKQTGSSLGVFQAYNFDEQNYLSSIDEGILMSLSNIFSTTLFNVDHLQGMLTNTDLLQAQFDLSNEACVFLNTQQAVTKLNKTAEVIFNTTASAAVGLQAAEFLGVKNNHFLTAINKLTQKDEDGGKPSEQSGSLLDSKQDHERSKAALKFNFQQLIGSYVVTSLGRQSKADLKERKVPANFYVHRLTTEHQQTFGFLIVVQPVVLIS